MHFTEQLVAIITHAISVGGYPLVGFLMVLESMVFPVPSEAVMPFAGFLVASGEMNFWWALVVSTIGSIIGSLISYYIGLYGGRVAIEKWGKYLMLNIHHLETTDRFFGKYGEWTIFVSRFIPIVRHLISLPAGIAKMPVGKFLIYTVLGAGMWNALLLYVGVRLGARWSELGAYMHYFDIVAIVIILLGVGYFMFSVLRNRGRK